MTANAVMAGLVLWGETLLGAGLVEDVSAALRDIAVAVAGDDYAGNVCLRVRNAARHSTVTAVTLPASSTVATDSSLLS